jgi:N-methylhydantoinase B
MLARQRQHHVRVLRETAIVDDGLVLTRKLDHGLLSHDAAATDVKRAPRPAGAGVFFGRGPGYVLLWGGAFFADVTRVAP